MMEVAADLTREKMMRAYGCASSAPIGLVEGGLREFDPEPL